MIEHRSQPNLRDEASALEACGRAQESVACLDTWLALHPEDVPALTQLAKLLYRLDRRDEARASINRAVALAPTDLSALNVRGMILDDMGRHEEALADFDAVLAIAPRHPEAITNRGIMHARAGEFPEALECYNRSLALNPAQANAVYNRSVIRLVLGDWARGFREYESRWQIFPHEATRLARLAPRWQGGAADLSGKTLLLHHEQGYGDTLQFARYVPWVIDRGARVFVAVPAGLRKLMTTLRGAPSIVSDGEPVPPHDLHCPLMSLPLAFGTTPTTVPTEIPYLRADPSLIRRWGEQLGTRRRPRIGLVWSGRRYPPINHARDMTVDDIAPLLKCPADFVCLHTELSTDERAILETCPNVRWVGGQLKDFADTAGLLANLDLLITVDTAVAHLAGALGKPVWLMNRYASCWRWLLNRTDSPWYPSLRLFRQPRLADWLSVVQDVLRALEGLQGIPSADAALPAPESNSAATMKPADLGDGLQQALDHHNQGRLPQAIAGYEQMLASFPNHSETLHYLGVALAQCGRFADALGPLARAIETHPDNPTLHVHYGNALAGLSRYDSAMASYERALARDSTLIDGHYNYGVALTAIGRPDAALARYAQAIKLKPDHAQAHNNQGNLLCELHRLPEALECYERAIAADPRFSQAWVNRSHILRRMHRYEDALASSEQAVVCNPASPEAHNSRGAVLAALGRCEEALASYDRALELHSGLAETPAWANRAHLQGRLHRYEEALASSERALGADPTSSEAHNIRGAILARLGRYQDALTSYDRAVELNPSLSEALWNKSLVKLAEGQYVEGWRLYEARWGVRSLKLTRRFVEMPAWNGVAPLLGKTILLHTEQGYGDAIQFARYCALLAARGARVLLSAPASLKALFTSLAGVALVIGQEDTPAFDVHSSLMSLPLACGTDLKTIPAPARYLRASEAAVERWTNRLGAENGTPRIGIAWSGSAKHSNDVNRSMPLEALLPITHRHLQWFSLQKEIRDSDQKHLTKASHIMRCGERLTDFADTAGLLETLDLVITVDTVIAHLAGALGKPVWILLPFVADWRWMRNREDSPWYPSARLFRQTVSRDWSAVVERLVDELRCFSTPTRSTEAFQQTAGDPSRASASKQ